MPYNCVTISHEKLEKKQKWHNKLYARLQGLKAAISGHWSASCISSKTKTQGNVAGKVQTFLSFEKKEDTHHTYLLEEPDLWDYQILLFHSDTGSVGHYQMPKFMPVFLDFHYSLAWKSAMACCHCVPSWHAFNAALYSTWQWKTIQIIQPCNGS